MGALTIAGAIMVYMGGFILTDEKLKGISGLLIGVGSVLAVLGVGNMVYSLWLNKPQNKVKMMRKLE